MMNNESKRERFVRLAEARTNKIIDMLKLLGNCSNSNVYEYTKADVEKIFGAIDDAVKTAKQEFMSKTNTDKCKFRL
jgi:murein L,D-transpeptidase YafK